MDPDPLIIRIGLTFNSNPYGVRAILRGQIIPTFYLNQSVSSRNQLPDPVLTHWIRNAARFNSFKLFYAHMGGIM